MQYLSVRSSRSKVRVAENRFKVRGNNTSKFIIYVRSFISLALVKRVVKQKQNNLALENKN